jgi:hypothetical protein
LDVHRGWLDGPHVVTDLRNIVIHPIRKRRDEFISGDLPWEEAARLALWFGELAMLGLCGYHGLTIFSSEVSGLRQGAPVMRSS